VSKKLMELVTKALKKASVELKDDAKEIISDALGSDALKEAGLIELGSTQRVVETTDYNELHADARKLRTRAQEAETERDRLKTALASGDSENKQLAARYKADLDKYQPLAERTIKRARVDWASKSAQLPAEKADAKDDEKKRVTSIRSRFVFAEKDKELDENQLLSNLEKFDELADLGVFAASTTTTKVKADVVPVPRGNTNGDDDKKFADKDEAWTDWYEKSDPKAAAGNAR
jgi:hypothetical protein